MGSVRRECLDFMIPLGEKKHLRRILSEWVTHYNQGRPHLSLEPGIPESTAVFPPLQGHDKHFFLQDCKVVAPVEKDRRVKDRKGSEDAGLQSRLPNFWLRYGTVGAFRLQRDE